MKVLMVEDERDLADAVAAILQKNNFSVDNAYDGEYGLDCALTGIYDFIILDIMLPKMDGLRVLKEMRNAGISTPVLMLTAKGELRDVESHVSLLRKKLAAAGSDVTIKASRGIGYRIECV